jgi:hypothetical protein
MTNRRRPFRALRALRRPLGRRLGLWLFVLSLAMGGLPVLPAPDAATVALLADAEVICTPGGMLRRDGSPAAPAGHFRSDACLLCQPLSHAGGGLLVALAPPVVVPPAAAPSSEPLRQAVAPPRRPYRPQLPRAPPRLG